jgi:hypothetical protein
MGTGYLFMTSGTVREIPGIIGLMKIVNKTYSANKNRTK